MRNPVSRIGRVPPWFSRAEGHSGWSSLLVALFLVSTFGCGKPAESPPPEIRQPEALNRKPARQIRQVERPAPDPVEHAEEETAAAPSRPSATGSELGRGLIYRNDRVSDVPWSISLLKIDRSRDDFELTASLGGRKRTIGLSQLSAQVEALPAEAGQPLAAINGDFYRTEQEPFAGDPRGLLIMRGELISSPAKVSFWLNTNGSPVLGNTTARFTITWPGGETTPFGLNEECHATDAILYTARQSSSTRSAGGRDIVLEKSGDGPWLPLRPNQNYAAQVRDVRASGSTRLSADTLVLSVGAVMAMRIPQVKAGAVLQISTAMSPDLTGVQTGLGGGPVLVHEGKIQPAYANKSRERHPRTAFGWNDKYYYFVQVDGRQHGFSVGMTLPELAAYLVREGCQEAINLDGGGSSEMWIEGQVVNRPCFGYERNTADGLVLVRKTQTASR